MKSRVIHQFIMVELLPEHPIYAKGEHVTGEQLEAFVRVFRATWHRLPADVRERILSLWHAWSQPQQRVAAEDRPDGTLSFTVKFAPVRLIGRFWAGRHANGQCGLGGTEVKFNARALQGELGVFVSEVIAHELAHVYQYAANSRATLSDAEADAARLLRKWGFWCGPRGRASLELAANAEAAAREADGRRRGPATFVRERAPERRPKNAS